MEQAIYKVFSGISYTAESFDLIPVSFMFRLRMSFGCAQDSSEGIVSKVERVRRMVSLSNHLSNEPVKHIYSKFQGEGGLQVCT